MGDRLRAGGRAVKLWSIVNDSADDLVRLLGLGRIGVAMPCQSYERLPDCPAPCPLPGCWIEPDRRVEYVAAFSIEECPRNNEIAGRVADSGAAKINHRTEPPFVHQKIARGNVTMNPHRWPAP